MEYSKSVPRAILNHSICVSSIELVQYDLALSPSISETAGVSSYISNIDPKSINSTRQIVLTRDELIMYKLGNCKSASWKSNSNDGDEVLNRRNTGGPHRRQKPEMMYELTMSQRWFLVVHDLKHTADTTFNNETSTRNAASTIGQLKYALILVRKRTVGSGSYSDAVGGTTDNCRSKKRRLLSILSKKRQPETKRQHQIEPTLTGRACNSVQMSNSSTGSSATNSSLEFSSPSNSFSDSSVPPSFPGCLITHPEILSHPQSQLESLTLIFRSDRDRRVWLDILEICVQRIPIFTEKPLLSSPIVSSPYSTSPGHTLFRNIDNLTTLKGSNSSSGTKSMFTTVIKRPSCDLTPQEMTPAPGALAPKDFIKCHRSRNKAFADRVKYLTNGNFKFGSTSAAITPELEREKTRDNSSTCNSGNTNSNGPSADIPADDCQPDIHTTIIAASNNGDYSCSSRAPHGGPVVLSRAKPLSSVLKPHRRNSSGAATATPGCCWHQEKKNEERPSTAIANSSTNAATVAADVAGSASTTSYFNSRSAARENGLARLPLHRDPYSFHRVTESIRRYPYRSHNKKSVRFRSMESFISCKARVSP